MNASKYGCSGLDERRILSIIVPSYNMEKYLPKCLGSLVLAPEQMDRLEVLIVNDGSKDRTSEIAHEFAAKCPGTFKVIDKPNGNYGSCINAALPQATGKFVKVLDADDSYDTANLEKFLVFLETCEADLAISNFVEVDDKGNRLTEHLYDYPTEGCFSLESYLDDRRYHLWMHAMAYRTAIFREFTYQQTEGVSYSDTEWTLVPLVGVKRVAFFSEVVYLYCTSRDGRTMSGDSFAKNFWMAGKVVLHVLKQYVALAQDLDSSRRRSIDARIVECMSGYYFGAIFGYGAHEIKVDLDGFDRELRVLSKALYDQCADAQYSKRYPCHFIRAWRSHSAFGRFKLWSCRVYTKFARRLG